jgi:hypothetical protein
VIPRAGEAYVAAHQEAKVLSRGAREPHIRKTLDSTCLTRRSFRPSPQPAHASEYSSSGGSEGHLASVEVRRHAGMFARGKGLAAYVELNAPRIETYRQKKEYGNVVLLLLAVREQVDAFFDKVMVDDERVGVNRLVLLQTLLRDFSTIAHFSEIVTEGKESQSSSKQ